VLHNAMVLTSSLEGKIKHTLAALESVLGSAEGVVAAVAKAPTLLVSAVETIQGNVEVMQNLGLSGADIRMSAAKQPQLFKFNYRSEGFQAKLRYFDAVLGRSPRHMLVEQPWALTSALKRVDYRVSHETALLLCTVLPSSGVFALLSSTISYDSVMPGATSCAWMVPVFLETASRWFCLL